MIEAIIFDWKQTLYDPEHRELMAGSMEVLQFFRPKIPKLFLVGKDPKGDMSGEISRLEVASFFDDIRLVTGDKSNDDIGRFVDAEHPEQTLVVGDRIKQEIKVGNGLGALTVWIQKGSFADEVPENAKEEPDYTITDIKELIGLSEAIL